MHSASAKYGHAGRFHIFSVFDTLKRYIKYSLGFVVPGRQRYSLLSGPYTCIRYAVLDLRQYSFAVSTKTLIYAVIDFGLFFLSRSISKLCALIRIYAVTFLECGSKSKFI